MAMQVQPKHCFVLQKLGQSMKLPSLFALTLLLSFSSPQNLLGGDSDKDTKPRLRVTRIERPIQLSGKLDDPLWKYGQAVSLAFEIQPGENTPAPNQTFAMALYTKEYLYIGFRCTDPNLARSGPTWPIATRSSKTIL